MVESISADAHTKTLHGRVPECEGDCDSDANCASGLKCFQRSKFEAVKGCVSGGKADVSGGDYCYNPLFKGTATRALVWHSWSAEAQKLHGRMKRCQGDCDVDANCAPGLKCKQRNAREKVPGCNLGPWNYPKDVSGWDYCYDPKVFAGKCTDIDGCKSTTCPSLPDDAGETQLRALGADAHTMKTHGLMQECVGDCDSDANCNEGLKCFQRSGHTAVKGCKSGGAAFALVGNGACLNAGGSKASASWFKSKTLNTVTGKDPVCE